ncbi:competence type IV pilus minor pilin ComGD [Bacillus sp. DTU_2020_1000418_1_SI_GHA_SEK_038]|uniref:competence type IV pilus minor pilin ComGD n=1 Tax=Bacillus sp. DTU_2020_1000418_1_SI_GHA_SEK_038 TaxID=3077585 RepID=UPI0028E3949D|nr:competence type IV pilus minor pilin ComGD [Bacillus sp. DTU_2020_1000418_1_SI_GHA_SEK_038]WNS74216.1 competence type IV pilus minor pilin ComGD [Bacillus sp. DTU_2020_1000418_1_SI_GHA_SEK_038]
MVSKQGGFTLIESLFVLSVFLIIASVPAFLLKPHFISFEKEKFISQLKADLFYAQQYALSHHIDVYVHILPEESKYVVHEKLSANYLIEREIPEMITVQEESMKLYFQFQSDGNINRFGSFVIFAGREKYRFMFYIGKGRFYVAKE